MEILRDDLTNELIEEGQGQTIEFTWKGQSYRIDLTQKNADAFEAAVSKYVKAAIPMRAPAATRAELRSTATRGRPATAAGSERAEKKEELAAMRAWWRGQGHEIADRGRIPQAVVDAYHAANPPA